MSLASVQKKSDTTTSKSAYLKCNSRNTTVVPAVLNDTQVINRKAGCTCGGGCPKCQANKSGIQSRLTIGALNDKYEQEADRVADQVMRMPEPKVQRQSMPEEEVDEIEEHIQAKSLASAITPLIQRQDMDEEDEGVVQTKNNRNTAPKMTPSISSDIQSLRGGGQLLSNPVRGFFEPRIGADFSNVRIHNDARAARAAQSVSARAFTLGHDVVFGAGEYSPDTTSGRKLLAHELTHVVQQGMGSANKLQRTPASKVNCAPGPLNVPGAPPLVIADPVGVITTAEDTANQLLDDLIGEIDYTRGRILAGEPAAWPTISDALAFSIRIMGLDPDVPAMWTAPTGTGSRSVSLLLRRLRLIRGTIGAGSFFFTCLGPASGTIGSCSGPMCDGGNHVVSCPASFRIAFCEPFWRNTAEDQAARIIHESAHNFADFVGHHGRFVNAECFVRAAQMFGGVDEGLQRTDLCPNP